jgi:UDP-glucose 4-epimerase
MTERIMITGGTGYIGTHVAVDLIEHGHHVTLLDNLANSSAVVLDRIEQITGTRPTLHEADIRDADALDAAFAEPVDSVIHCAGLKAVGESVAEPLRYYDNNVTGTIVLLEAMQRAGVHRLVFSSSATVYGDPRWLPLTEDHPVGPTNPYGRTKAQIEQILEDQCTAEPAWQVVSLRYFNPVGAHPSGLIGEDPSGTPNNLMPRVLEVATGKWDGITVWGTDWDTPDGTGVRDYLHVVDLAVGHRAAIDSLPRLGSYSAVNLGTGRGYSVLEVIEGVRTASGAVIPVEKRERRPGDIATSTADPSLARTLLGWTAERGIDEMCADSWRWRSANPDGYRQSSGAR